jgi:hypothetical protein
MSSKPRLISLELQHVRDHRVDLDSRRTKGPRTLDFATRDTRSRFVAFFFLKSEIRGNVEPMIESCRQSRGLSQAQTPGRQSRRANFFRKSRITL